MSENLAEVLGLSQEVNGFKDNKPRMAHPVTMRNFPGFVNHFAQVNVKKLWTNFLFDDGKEHLIKVLEMTFVDDSIDELLDNITAKTYKNIMDTLMAINGIEFESEATKNQMEV
jgi:hypothetical protein